LPRESSGSWMRRIGKRCYQFQAFRWPEK